MSQDYEPTRMGDCPTLGPGLGHAWVGAKDGPFDLQCLWCDYPQAKAADLVCSHTVDAVAGESTVNNVPMVICAGEELAAAPDPSCKRPA